MDINRDVVQYETMEKMAYINVRHIRGLMDYMSVRKSIPSIHTKWVNLMMSPQTVEY